MPVYILNSNQNSCYVAKTELPICSCARGIQRNVELYPSHDYLLMLSQFSLILISPIAE